MEKRKGMWRGNDMEKGEKYGIIRLRMLSAFTVGGGCRGSPGDIKGRERVDILL